MNDRSTSLSEDQVSTLAAQLSIVLVPSEGASLDMKSLSPEDLRAIAAKAMERVASGEASLTDAATASRTSQPTIGRTTIRWDPPMVSDGDADTQLD